MVRGVEPPCASVGQTTTYATSAAPPTATIAVSQPETHRRGGRLTSRRQLEQAPEQRRVEEQVETVGRGRVGTLAQQRIEQPRQVAGAVARTGERYQSPRRAQTRVAAGPARGGPGPERGAEAHRDEREVADQLAMPGGPTGNLPRAVQGHEDGRGEGGMPDASTRRPRIASTIHCRGIGATESSGIRDTPQPRSRLPRRNPACSRTISECLPRPQSRFTTWSSDIRSRR